MKQCYRLVVVMEETGVAILPGSSFERDPEELTARMAYVDFDGAKALTASETTALESPLPDKFVDMWCHKVVRAVELIAEWVKQ